MDLKDMPKLNKDHKLILCIIDEVTNYLITVLIYHSRSVSYDPNVLYACSFN